MMRRLFSFDLFFSILFCCSFFTSYSQVTEGLISSYYFSGNARDSVGSIHGIVRGATLAPDRFGNPNASYSFDGTSDLINLGTNRDLRQMVISISLWVKVHDFKAVNRSLPAMPILSTRVRHDVEYYEAYTIGVYPKNRKFAASNNSPIQQQVSLMSATAAKEEEWNHVVFMFDNDSTYLFVNGKMEQKNFKGFVSTYLVSDSVVLGYDGNLMPDTFKYSKYAWFNGCLDDLKFYNRILTPQEVDELYREPNPRLVGKSEKPTGVPIRELFMTFWYVPLSFILFVLMTIIFVRWRLKVIRKREHERNEIDKQLAQMEMRALRSQMNPHFIFNALNSIQHYVLTNEKDLANKYLVKFSQLMRNILELSKQELISLKDELETIRLYLDIESLRFENAFSYSLSIAPDVNTREFRLPPLIIQPFVENAIWHGLLLKEGNKILSINVYADKEDIIIEIDDNGIGREASYKFRSADIKRRSFGMEITAERLSILEKIFGIAMSFEVKDKVDKDGAAMGTTVILKLKIKI